MYELIRFMYKHIWQVQKGEPKDLSLLHSAKCSVSTQLTYIQKYSTTRFQSVQSRILQRQSLKLLKYLFTLRIEYFANSEIFCNFLGFLDSWISCHFGFFTTFGTNLQIFTLVKQNHKTLPSPKIAKNTKITSKKHKMKT